MPRWKTIASRLMLLVLFGTFLLLAIDPVVRWSITNAGRAVTGADVSVDSLRTSWRDCAIEMQGVRATEPGLRPHPIFNAESILLELDSAALARRKVVVSRAKIDGLEVGTDRRAPAIRQHEDDGEYTAALFERFVTDGGQWLETAGEELNRQMTGSSSTAEALLEVLGRAPDEYAKLEKKAAEITNRIHQLEGSLSEVGENPLRNATSFGQAMNELEVLGRELKDVRRGADQLHQQMLMDRDSFANTQADDLHSMQQQLNVASLDANNLTEYLLGPEVAFRVNSLARWVRWGRNFLPALSNQSTTMLRRGRNVNLLAGVAEPDILLQTVVLNGHALVGDSRLQLEGSIAGLSTDQSGDGNPAEIVVQTTGETQLLIQASFAGRGDTANDTIMINCPNLHLPERMLGDSTQLALKVDAAKAHLWIKLDIAGDQLAGQLVMKQDAASLQPIMGSELQQTPVARLVSEATLGINTIDVAVDLRGSVDNPEWNLRSNLGHDLASELQTGLQRQVARRDHEQTELARNTASEQLLAVTEALTDRHETLCGSIDQTAAAVDLAVERMASQKHGIRSNTNPNSPLRETILR